ncbi:fibulin-2 isoform X1 [Synchiropus splendidus]|uniref:fibulin-2 isoform X1 n=1 Tax=Synchiropus splendidus TaxID=270530 RepID=UPI00237E03C7|nr:fibulin-2 isoform X1 [Synchiropus splendidus]
MDLFITSKVLLLFAYLRVSFSLPDCSGVDCPLLENCIEEVLERGSCCPSCLQQGCMCEGYQYYDCISAGFKNGKVPEGDSYFVDYGSTECSCPRGGGRISCSFISCPEMPPNCIEVSEPLDGCMQCERVGCVQGTHKYVAGHSFKVEPCRVCHCPSEGGKLMCYTISDCEPGKHHKQMSTTAEDEVTARGQQLERFRVRDRLSPDGKLSLFTSILPEKEQPEDYEYGLTDSPETYPGPEAFLVEGTSREGSESKAPNSNRGGKLELKEKYASQDREEVVASPLTHSTVSPASLDDGLDSWKGIADLNVVTESHAETARRSSDKVIVPMETAEDLLHQHGEVQINRGGDSLTTKAADGAINVTPSPRASETDQETESYGEAFSLATVSSTESLSFSQTGTTDWMPLETSEVNEEERLKGSEAPLAGHTLGNYTTDSTTAGQGLGFTTEPLVVKKESQTISHDMHHEGRGQEDRDRLPGLILNSSPGQTSSSDDLLHSCCSAGARWAAEHDQCSHMPQHDNDTFAVCSVAQMQCCLSSLHESRCEAGVMSARGGDACNKVNGQDCAGDPYQVCCSCCALGMRVRSLGHGCDPHQDLGYPCGHVFLHCCQDAEGQSLFSLRTKQGAEPTAVPRTVFDLQSSREASSVSTRAYASNKLEEQEDVDECRSGQLCQHTCTNIFGSYFCGCNQGFILQQDGHSCVSVIPEKDNEMSLVRPAVSGTTTAPTTTVSQPVLLDPCAGNGGCSQQCRTESGRSRCSCFPGFSLMRDGRTCQDVDECMTNTHSCRSGESCVNMVGSFVCELQVNCPAGYRLRNRVCEDIDECVQGTHNCGVGFACENTEGSFMCISKQRCISGFTRDQSGNCVDIDECSSSPEPCGPGFSCINTVGSFKCQQKVIMCSHGYRASAVGDKCVDIDECQVGAHHCGLGQICHNMPGSYRCDCQTGYQYDSLGKVCKDINECWRYPGRLCGQTCENTLGSYHCSCTAGFSLASDGKNCEDVNECENNPCGQECANIYGSYQCYCRQGYYLKENRHTCEDIDECSQTTTNLCAFQCINVAGSYQCACPPHGYVLSANRRTCKDIDECSTGRHNCSSGQVCYNLQGSYRCLSFNCPYNYRKVSDIRCERVSCPGNSLDCQNSPIHITYYQLSFQTNTIVPAQIFRIGPSPAYSGDHVVISITRGNEEGYFSTRKLNTFTGAVFLQRQVRQPSDFLLDVEMKLLRQGTVTRFLTKIYVFITDSAA